MLRSFVTTIVLYTNLSLFAGPKVLWEESIKAYDDQNYKVVIKNLDSLIKSGITNKSIYFNLGNSYYRTGQKGEAIAAYLAARSLAPRDLDVRSNLKFVHNQITDKSELSDKENLFKLFTFWVDKTTTYEWGMLLKVLVCILFILLSLYIITPKLNFLKNFITLFGLASLITLIGLTTTSYLSMSWGAVTSANSSVYSGPNKKNTVLFMLNEGTPFIFKENQNNWYKIQLPSGQKGWVPTSNAKVYF